MRRHAAYEALKSTTTFRVGMRRLPAPEFFVPDAVHERRRRDEALRQVDATHDLLVVSHKKCLDGVSSYLMHCLASGTEPPVIFTYPNDIAQVLGWVATRNGAGKVLSINDLSMDAGQVDAVLEHLQALRNQGWKVMWRDHHHKQWEGVDTDRVEALTDRFVLDDKKAECGASLAQQDLLPDDQVARALADIARDRDLWHNADPRGEQYEFALRHLGTEEFVQRFLATRDVDAAWIKAAADAERVTTDAEVETAIYTAELFGPNNEVGVIYGDVPKNVTLHRLREARGTKLEINLKPEGRFSVRSAAGADVCHLVGQAYGGGGHPNAAGGLVPVPFYEWPMYWAKGGLSAAGMGVVRTAVRLVQEHATTETGPGGTEDRTQRTPSKPDQKVARDEATKATGKAAGGASLAGQASDAPEATA